MILREKKKKIIKLLLCGNVFNLTNNTGKYFQIGNNFLLLLYIFNFYVVEKKKKYAFQHMLFIFTSKQWLNESYNIVYPLQSKSAFIVER